MSTPYRSSRLERGATLVVSLIMLVLVTLIATMGVRISISDERGARATQQRQLAFQAAEAGLRDAEADLTAGTRTALFASAPTGFTTGCPDAATIAATPNLRGLCLPAGVSSTPLWQTVDFATRGVAYGTFTGQTWPGAGAAPRYVIETYPFITPGGAAGGPRRPALPELVYRITATASNPTGDHVVGLQSAFRR